MKKNEVLMKIEATCKPKILTCVNCLVRGVNIEDLSINGGIDLNRINSILKKIESSGQEFSINQKFSKENIHVKTIKIHEKQISVGIFFGLYDKNDKLTPFVVSFLITDFEIVLVGNFFERY